MSIAGYLACGRNERDRREELERALVKRTEQVVQDSLTGVWARTTQCYAPTAA